MTAADTGPAILLDGVGKRYTKYDDAPTLLGHAIRLRSGNRRSSLWAIRGVNLTVDQGETVGVIGRNGSGKSTLLAMLAGVTAPTEGRVVVRGRIAPLISVGVGFHPELTGRENLFVNGSILGMTRQEIAGRVDDILDFAEIHDFIDTPVKFYSSGMFVRLGFAVAVAARPDVLLVDEVLAVGDIAFQARCFERMRQMQAEGTTIFVVSHQLTAIRSLCSRVLVVHDGTPSFLGTADDAISEYHQLLETDRHEGYHPAVEVEDLALFDASGGRTAHLTSGDEVCFRLQVRFPTGAPRPVFGLHIMTDEGITVYSDSTIGTATRDYGAGERAQCEIRLRPRLTTGSYAARAFVWWGPGNEVDDTRAGSRPLLFFVSGRRLVNGVADLQASFTVDGVPSAARPAS